MTEMDKQNCTLDTITAMEKYNFQKPMNVSIVYEDDEEEANQSTLDPEANNLNSPNLHESSQGINYTAEHQHPHFTETPILNTTKSRESRFHRTCSNESERCADCCPTYVQTNIGNNLKAKKVKNWSVGKKQRNKTILINKVTKILKSIKDASKYYGDVITKTKDEQHKSRFRDDWLNVKHNLFNRCLAISKDFLLQNGDNDRLIKELVFKIEQIVDTPITFNVISNLNEDLIRWIKLKMFQMTDHLKEQSERNSAQNQNFLAETSHPYSDLSSIHHTHNNNSANRFSSQTPGNQITPGDVPNNIVLHRNVQNKPNSTATNSCFDQDNNTNTLFIPQTNYYYLDNNYQQNEQSTNQRLPMWPQFIYNEPQINYSNNASINLTNPLESQDVIRSSISRDSGFTSPVTSVSPENYYNNMQSAFTQYEHRALANHAPIPWQGVTPYQ